MLEVDVLAVINGKLEPLGKRIYNRRTNAVKSARNLVSAAAEFSARVEDGVNNGSRTYALLGMYAGGDSTSVVGDFYNVAL